MDETMNLLIGSHVERAKHLYNFFVGRALSVNLILGLSMHDGYPTQTTVQDNLTYCNFPRTQTSRSINAVKSSNITQSTKRPI